MEHEVAPGITESLKVMTRDGTRRIAQYAFEYATLNNRAKVSSSQSVKGRLHGTACQLVSYFLATEATARPASKGLVTKGSMGPGSVPYHPRVVPTQHTVCRPVKAHTVCMLPKKGVSA